MKKKIFVSFLLMLFSNSSYVLAQGCTKWWGSHAGRVWYGSSAAVTAVTCAKQQEKYAKANGGCLFTIKSCAVTKRTYYYDDPNRPKDWIALNASKICSGQPYPDIDLWMHADGVPCAYVAIHFDGNPPPKHCSGNPVDTITGKKIQHETIIPARGPGSISFALDYASASTMTALKSPSKWQHNYHRYIVTAPANQDVYIATPRNTKKSACTNGLAEFKSKIGEGWIQGSTVQWDESGQTCKIMKNAVVVSQLTIAHEPNIAGSPHIDYFQLNREDGSKIAFYKTGLTTYSPLNDNYGFVINRGTDVEPVFHHHHKSGAVDVYNSEGQLISITHEQGTQQTLTYDETTRLLSRVKDSSGRELQFIYTGTQLTGISVDGKTTRFAYNSNGMLSSIRHPDNTTRQYHYEDTRFPGSLTGITDERNKRYASWAYDDKARAIFSEHAGGADKTLLVFNDNASTTVTNPLGKRTQYFYSFIAGANRIVRVEGEPTANCEGANQNYTYTPEGWLESKTDWKGIKTTYQYNARGQETSRTEAVGTTEARTIATEWHPTLYVKTRITEPEKYTTFNYDTNGRLLNQQTRAINN